MGAPKYTQAKAVVAAAESNPEKFGDLPAKMDDTGNVYGTHRELERRKAGDFNGEKKRRPLVFASLLIIAAFRPTMATCT